MKDEKLWFDHPQDSAEITTVRQRTEDVLEHAITLPFWSQDYTQLDKGHFSGMVTSVASKGVQLFREAMNRSVDELASAPQDSYVIGLPTIIEGKSLWRGGQLSKNTLITLDKNAELLFRTSHSSEITAAVISEQRLEDYAANVEQIDINDLMKKVNPVEVIPHAVKSRLLSALFIGTEHLSKNLNDSMDHHQVWRHVEDSVLDSCLQALMAASENHSRHNEHRVHRHIVNCVRDITLSRHCEVLTIGDLCTTLNVSRRTLNHAFKQVLGITPVAYMRNVRLHRIRAELKFSPKQVTSIANVATRWGFWHMSLFSRYYRELFGESSSMTLELARGQ